MGQDGGGAVWEGGREKEEKREGEKEEEEEGQADKPTFSEHLLCASQGAKTSCIDISFNTPKNLLGTYSLFASEETKAQRGYETSLKSHSQ